MRNLIVVLLVVVLAVGLGSISCRPSAFFQGNPIIEQTPQEAAAQAEEKKAAIVAAKSDEAAKRGSTLMYASIPVLILLFVGGVTLAATFGKLGALWVRLGIGCSFGSGIALLLVLAYLRFANIIILIGGITVGVVVLGLLAGAGVYGVAKLKKMLQSMTDGTESIVGAPTISVITPDAIKESLAKAQDALGVRAAINAFRNKE